LPPHAPRLLPYTTLFRSKLEVAAIVGRGGRDLKPERADANIAGFTVMSNWTARGPATGKDFATSLGPTLVMPDELAPMRKDKARSEEHTSELQSRVEIVC